MCGIAGYLDYKDFLWAMDPKDLDRMTDALAHRGPDARGIFQGTGIGLGHRRLSIIDVQASANQPMSAADGKLWIVFNGEIYNYKELRVTLERAGHDFKTTSDTEVLLYSYLEWGLECIQRLSGIFAFALWDSGQRRLWLARDPLGVKPLLYADRDGQIFFASEMGAFSALPFFDIKFDPVGINAFFSFGYVPAPYTGYRGIFQLLPGQWLLIEGGKKQFHKYWDIDLAAKKWNGPDRELVEAFDALVNTVLKRQTVSDVPIGAFLSGGIDSFAVVRSLRNIGKTQVKAFSIGFRDRRYNELPYAKMAADRLGIELIAQYMDGSGPRAMRDLRRHCLDPLADLSCLPTYLLCEMTARNVKVALSGDGGDELLGGYETYQASTHAKSYRKIPSLVRRNLIRPVVRHIPESGKRYSLRQKATRFTYGADQGKWRDHASWRLIFTNEQKEHLFTDDFLKTTQEFDPIELYAKPMKRAKEHGCSDLDCQLYADLSFYLPNDMLMKVDRMSMAHGLEVRVPLLDKELVEFAWRLPEHLKMGRGGKGKYILRKVIEHEFPEKLKRLPKMGFNVPGSLIPDQIRYDGSWATFLKTPELAQLHLDHYQRFLLYIISSCKEN